jgi:hypothetical protein
MGRKREIDSVDKLIHVVARQYRSGGFGISRAPVRNECSDLKIVEVWDRKISA